jgi:molybdate transport system ATP-binding protein
MCDDTVLRADVVRTLPGFSLAAQFDVGCEVLVLFGPSGSGKSLTLQAIAGVDRPDGGSIVLDIDGDETVLFDSAAGIDVKPQQRRIGYVPQSLALFPHLTVQENITYGLRGQSKSERGEAAKRLLALMRLSDLQDRLPRQLSGGQRQRVALARALAVEPRLLLLDEPFTALDGPTRRALRHEVRRLHEERGVPVLLVTHDTDEAFALADRIAVIDAGRVLQIADRDGVFSRPVSRRVAELVGVENILPGVVRSVGSPGSSAGDVVINWGEMALLVREPRPTVADLTPGARVDLALGASQITVLKESDPVSSDSDGSENAGGEGGRANVIAVRAARIEMARDTIRMDLLPQGSAATLLRLEIPAYAYYRLGLDQREQFHVQLKPEWLHLMATNP